MQKRLFAIFLVVFLAGLFLLLYDLALSLILLVPSGVGIGVLLTEQTGVRQYWWQIVYLKARGKTRKAPEKRKVPPWFIAWWIVWCSFGVFDVYLLSAVPSVGVMLFYAWIASLFVLLYHQFGK